MGVSWGLPQLLREACAGLVMGHAARIVMRFHRPGSPEVRAKQDPAAAEEDALRLLE